MPEEPKPNEAGSAVSMDGEDSVPAASLGSSENPIADGDQHGVELVTEPDEALESIASTGEVPTQITDNDVGNSERVPELQTVDAETHDEQDTQEAVNSIETGKDSGEDIDDETAIMNRVDAIDSTPQTPELGTLHTTPINKVHSLGDLHGWAPGLIAYLIHHQLAEIEIDGYPMQTESGDLHVDNLNATFQNPVLRWHNRPKSGLKGHPGGQWYGAQNEGHGAIKARWIADPSVAFVQVGDIFDRADHSELAAEILRQLIVDAPGRVFVLVGNHEQFMLENDFSNWAHNEIRSAYTDHIAPKKNERAHFRFYSPGYDTDEMMEEVFYRYKSSVWTLFLTQGAVLKELGWLEKHLANTWDFSGMLDTGWSPYEHADTLRKKVKKGDSIPGAISALTMNDILFHHAEPAAHQADRDGHLLELHRTISSQPHPALNEFKLQMYRYGGESLHGSDDQRLLWARGSSSGANSGNPAAQQHLDDLANNWPGLHRIVHGHTPTVGLSEFNTVTSGESRPVSYNADASHHQPSKGRANKVRVHNIDEGMSPVYFTHSNDDPYDPCRVPIGLRMEFDSESQVEANHDRNEHVQIIEKASMHIDRRELWKWQEGQWKSNLPAVFENLDDRLFVGDEQDGWRCLLIIENTTEQAETSRQLSRSVGGRKVGSILINRCLNKLVHVKKQETPPAFEHVKPIGSGLLQGKTLSMLSSNNISFIAAKMIGKTLELHVVNGFEKAFDWEFTYAADLESKSKKVEISVPIHSHSTYSVENAGVVSVGPPGRSKPAIKFFRAQEGDGVTTNGVMAYYISSTRTGKTPTHKVKEEVYIVPQPQTSHLKADHNNRGSQGNNSSKGRAANRESKSGGVHGQFRNGKSNEKSVHDQHSGGADMGKGGSSAASDRASQALASKSSASSNRNESEGSSMQGQAQTNNHTGSMQGQAQTNNHTGSMQGQAQTNNQTGSLQGQAQTNNQTGSLQGQAQTNNQTGSLQGQARTNNQTESVQNQSFQKSGSPRRSIHIPEFDLDDFTSKFVKEVLDQTVNADQYEKVAKGGVLRFEYKVKSNYVTIHFRFIIMRSLNRMRIESAKGTTGFWRTLQEFEKQQNDMKKTLGYASPDGAEGEFLRYVEKLISQLNLNLTNLLENVEE